MSEMRRTAHPRPDRVRENWMMLNGAWGFAFDPENVGRGEHWERKSEFPLTIQVPFAYQAELSGVAQKDHCDVIWYTREITIPESMRGLRTLLHFGAVDYRAEVWLDGNYLGGHEGGYTPFTLDLTERTEPGRSYRLTVRCEDTLDMAQPRGKQSWKPEPFACWYTPVSGIWQSVWLEGVGEVYPVDFRLTPDIRNGCLRAELELNACPPETQIRMTAFFQGEKAALLITEPQHDPQVKMDLALRFHDTLEGLHLWTPDQPYLYDLTIETLVGGTVVDTVQTYFGMREITVTGDQVLLNENTLYQRLILDQGYWADGLLTAPDDDAFRKDIELTKAMGFNGVRKHQKFEDPQFLYWADHLGLLVWGELPSAYRLNDREKRNLMRDLSEAIRRDYNHPCLIGWTPLNESWGVWGIAHDRDAQRLADALTALARTLDGTRFVSGNDGWEQTDTDIVTVHDYTAWPEQLSAAYQDAETLLKSAPASRVISAEGYDHRGKPMLMTEYGGIAMAKDAEGGNWGYNGAVTDEESFLKRFGAITRAFRAMPYFRGYCYTQLTDVFQEVNGLLDMQRNPKVPVEKIREILMG